MFSSGRGDLGGGRGDRPDVPNYLVLLTDGRANEPTDAWTEAIAVREAGINVLVVGIGSGVDVMELQGFASEPVERNVLTARDFRSLDEELRQSVYNAVCDSKPPSDTGSFFLDY